MEMMRYPSTFRQGLQLSCNTGEKVPTFFWALSCLVWIKYYHHRGTETRENERLGLYPMMNINQSVPLW